MTIQDQAAIAAAIEENAEGGPSHNVPLGTLVLRAKLLPLEAIEESLREAIKSGRRLGELLVERGLGERDLARLLAAQYAQPFVDITEFPIDVEVARLLPRAVAQTYCALPIARDEGGITVAVPYSADALQRERLSDALKSSVRLVTAARCDIQAAIERLAPAEQEVVVRRQTPPTYDVFVRLVSGTVVAVDQLTSLEAAQALAERVAAEARVGATINMREGTVDGSDVVSIEIFTAGESPS
jgi:Type II secretion system (T2SS), protein E, N-terminal domain